MKVLYFDQYFPPEKASGSHLVQDLLDGMAKSGWEVNVFVPVPTRGVSDEVRECYKKNRIESTRGDRVIIHRMPLCKEGKNPIQRAFRYMIFSIKCFCKALDEKYDVVFTGSGPPTQGFVIGLASRIKGKPFIYNLQDIFPDSLVTTGLAAKQSIPWKIGRCIEDSSYRNATRIITISERMRANVLAKGADASKVSVVMNWEDVDTVTQVAKDNNPLFEELGIDSNIFTVLYAGNLGGSQGMESFLELAEDSSDLPIQFVIVGEGSEEEHLRSLASSMGLNNLLFRPLQPVSRVAEVYSMADIAYISCAPGVGKAGFPSKAWSIFATGKPVLASFDVDSDLGDAINDSHLGAISDPSDRLSRSKNLRSLFTDSQRRVEAGVNARRFAELKGSRDKAVSSYLEVIESTVSGGDIND
mgnify:FL=1